MRLSTQVQKHFPHLLIPWRTMPRDGIPPWARREAFGPTTRVTSDRNIVEHFRVLVDNGIQEADRSFAGCQPLLVQHVDDAGEDWRRR